MVADNQKGFAVLHVRILVVNLPVLILRKIELVFISENINRVFVSHKNTLMVEFRMISESLMTPLAKGQEFNINSSFLCKNYFHRASSVRHIYLFSWTVTRRPRRFFCVSAS